MTIVARTLLCTTVLACVCLRSQAEPFDATPFGFPLPEHNGVMWEEPREIHKVVARFQGAAPSAEKVHLEYWGSRWPEQHLPKDREPGGADVGWMELGNWYQGGWRVADHETKADGSTITFGFRPINLKEFPKVTNYIVDFRYTLKLRIVSEDSQAKLEHLAAFTDSTTEPRGAVLVWSEKPSDDLSFAAFNGKILSNEQPGGPLKRRVMVQTVVNNDPNTFDRTLVTVRNGKTAFTFAMDDLNRGPLFLPSFGVAVLPDTDTRNYLEIADAQKASGAKTLYNRIGEMPEQTWQAAWAGLPRKKSDINFPLGLDGGRQRFRLEANGSFSYRTADRYFTSRPGKDTPRISLEGQHIIVRFGLPNRPTHRTIEEASVPICHTTWETNGLRVEQTAFVTTLDGAKAEGPVPPSDAFAVLMARFAFTNMSSNAQVATLPMYYFLLDKPKALRTESNSIWLDDKFRALVTTDTQPKKEEERLVWSWTLAPGESKSLLLRFPYLVLTEAAEREALARLDFDKERNELRGYWHRRLDESARLVTPEPMLNEFYRSHAGHLLINCEREPDNTGRFARVGSFYYGAYGNESCMMVVDLDRRGYHKEAEECLDSWLRYQGTVGLPGDFSSKNGVLYGAGGYEDGGYNQHHGWILWCLAEHFRFTRDERWLDRASPGIVAAADWIIRESARTADRNELERGLLPPGRLEDIGDWWTWLSTSCYTWRGLDSAAWALEQLQHPDAQRIRKAADSFHAALLNNFHKASERSPVVRLRDGTAVPQIPSYVQRRGRSFGWICQTLEGAIHLLITGALDSRSPEAEGILKDYEDNLYLSNQYGYTVDDFDKHWFDRGGMSMQACLLLDVEPYLYRDDVKHALRALFNAQAVSYFPNVRMNTEHAAPYFDDWRGDHYKSSDESNSAGWLRQLFIREDGDTLLLGQAVPRDWLKAGQTCGMERAATYFGPMSIIYKGSQGQITAQVETPKRNEPKHMRVRFRTPNESPLSGVTVNGKAWDAFKGDWVHLPGDIQNAIVVVRY